MVLPCPNVLQRLRRTSYTARKHADNAAPEVILRLFTLSALALLVACSETADQQSAAEGTTPDGICFARHVIDSSGSGADGVHLGDINADGFIDVVSGWEESPALKVYFHPGDARLKLGEPWTFVEASGGSSVPNIEDAAFADIDSDGRLDTVVSASAGDPSTPGSRRVRIHQLAPDMPVESAQSWSASAIFSDSPSDHFMKVRAAQLDGVGAADIVALSRDLYDEGGGPDNPSKAGSVYLFTAPDVNDVATPEAWTRTELGNVRKGKSIELIDMDQDLDLDIVYAGTSTIAWLKNPGMNAAPDAWESQPIGSASDLAICDINGDGVRDIVATAWREEFPVVAKWFEPASTSQGDAIEWIEHSISISKKLPTKFYQLENFALKSIACGRFRADAKPNDPADIILTTSGSGYGIFLVVAPDNFGKDVGVPWNAAPLTEYKWITKYDNIITVDMDADGDTDFVTSEDDKGLLFQGAGVLWYENTGCR